MMSPHSIPSEDNVLDAWHRGVLDVLISETLKPIVGEPFVELGRAGDLIWIGFGEEVLSPTQRLPDRRLAHHRVHVRSPFRLDSASGAVLAAGDLFLAIDAPDDTPPDFDWDRHGANLFDARIAQFWRAHQPGSAVVEDVKGDPGGGLVMSLSDGTVLRIFPNRSGAVEHWRYFRAGDEAHFVVLPNRRE